MTEHSSELDAEDRVTRKLVSKEDLAKLTQHLAKLSPAQRQAILNTMQPRVVDKYMAHIPHPRQQVFLSLQNREVFFGGSGGGGKSDALLMSALQYALDVDTPLLTTDGWKTIGTSAVGDKVFDELGNPTAIVSKSPVFKTGDRYELVFDDGETIRADGDHLWWAESFADRMGMTRNPDYPKRFITTREMYKFQKTNHGNPKANWSIRINKALDFPERDLPLDPYLFGVWLGDGSKNNGTIAGLLEDDLVQAFLDSGFVCKKYPDRFHVTGLRTILGRMSVLGDKHIPDDYLYASREQRLELLKGLMDTDGTVDNRWGTPRFFQVKQDLFDQIVYLIRSLGWIPRTFKQKYRTKSGTKVGNLVTFIPDEHVFKMERKIARQILDRERATTRQGLYRIVREVHRLDDDSFDTQCIAVESDNHLFLAGESLTITHNCDVPGYSALLLRRTWPDLNKAGAILDRANQWFGGTDARKREGGRIWEFPCYDAQGNETLPARISFGYLDKENDKYKLQCFTQDHDILTDRGWVRVSEVTTNDLVASINPETELMSYEAVSATHKYDHQGKVVDIFQSKGVSMTVTLNHKLWVKSEYDHQLKPVRADQLTKYHHIPTTIKRATTEDDHNEWFVREIATNDYKQQRMTPMVRRFSSRDLLIYLKTVANVKKNGLMRVSLSVTHKKFLDDLMELATLAGLRATMSKILMGDNVNRYELTWSMKIPPNYVQIDRALTEPVAHNYVKRRDYSGKVFCISTPKYQTLVVRHRGRVHVSGNSAEYQFIGFDELTHFLPEVYTYSFSRLRKPAVSCINCYEQLKMINGKWAHAKPKKCQTALPDPKVVAQYQPAPDGLTIFDIPLRVRSASNPGGRSHDYVRDRFVNPKTRDKRAIFVPSSIHDNPSLDYDEYVESLEYLDPLEKARMLNGDWDVALKGEMFKRDWFKMLRVNQEPPGTAVRYWDNASSDGKGDYTVGLKMIKTADNRFVVSDVVRGQWSTQKKKVIMQQTAQMDGTSVAIRMEQEPGSSGVDVIDDMRRTVFLGYNFSGIRSTGDKVTRAAPIASATEGGLVYLMPGQWNKAFMDELIQVPNALHDDQLDAFAGAYNYLVGGKRVRLLV